MPGARGALERLSDGKKYGGGGAVTRVGAKMSRQSSYTVEYKLRLLHWHQDNGENMRATAQHFGIDWKCLREWLEKADRLRDNQVGVAKKKRKLNAGKDPLSLELDQAVLRS